MINIKSPKYKLTRRPDTNDALFQINNTDVFDTANYTFIARNAYLSKNMTFDFRVVGKLHPLRTVNFPEFVTYSNYEDRTSPQLHNII